MSSGGTGSGLACRVPGAWGQPVASCPFHLGLAPKGTWLGVPVYPEPWGRCGEEWGAGPSHPVLPGGGGRWPAVRLRSVQAAPLEPCFQRGGQRYGVGCGLGPGARLHC